MVDDVDTLIMELTSKDHSIRQAALDLIRRSGRDARAILLPLVKAIIADPQRNYCLTSVVDEIGPTHSCIDVLDFVYYSMSRDDWARRALDRIGKEMTQELIEQLITYDYLTWRGRLQTVRIPPETILDALVVVVGRDGVFPNYADYIPGSPPTYIHEQIRKIEDDQWLVANCNGLDGTRSFSSVRAAAWFFFGREMNWG